MNSDAVVLPITSGSSEMAIIVMARSELLLVCLVDRPDQPICAVQMGAVEPIEGYELPFQMTLSKSIKEGQQVKLLWISGHTQDTLPRVAFTTITGKISSPDLAVLSAGYGVPDMTLKGSMLVDYQTAVTEAARLKRGAWADQDLSSSLLEMNQSLLDLKAEAFKSNYYTSNPGLGIFILIAIVLVLAFDNRSKHEEIVEESKDRGPLRKVFSYPFKAQSKSLKDILFFRKK
jgi:hypothetical protein